MGSNSIQIRNQKRRRAWQVSQPVADHFFSHTILRSLELASENDAPEWLTSLPIEEFSFHLQKSAFFDAFTPTLPYGWEDPLHFPLLSCTYSVSFWVPKRGIPSTRQNEIRDMTAGCFTEICHDITAEPKLHPISSEVLSRFSNTAGGTRLDGTRLDGTRLDAPTMTFLEGRHKNFLGH